VDAGLLAVYRRSHYEIRLPGGHTRAILRIDEQVPAAVSDWLADMPFGAFITAYNPRSTTLPARDNRRAQHALLVSLRAANACVLTGVGRMPGESWREPSLFVAGLSLSDIDVLACRHSQNAVVLAHGNGVAQLRCYDGA
jgi:hypothetical protein